MNNDAKNCRSPVLHMHKPGWRETQIFQKEFLQNSTAPIIIIGDSIGAGLRNYERVWRSYFKDALNLGTSGDRVV